MVNNLHLNHLQLLDNNHLDMIKIHLQKYMS